MNFREKYYKNIRKISSKNLRSSSSISSIAGYNEKNSASFKKQQRTATAISKLASNKSNDEANFEHYFRSNYPWQKIYIAENVEKALEEVKKA